MTDEDERGLHHLSTETVSFAPGGDVAGGGGMTHTFWSPDSVEEQVTRHTASLGVEPDRDDDKWVFAQTTKTETRTTTNITVIEDADGHRLAPPEARAIVTVLSSTLMRRSETKILAAPPSQPETDPDARKRRWAWPWNRRPRSSAGK